MHFVLRLPQSWLTIPTFSQLGVLKAEIQVRTVAQHIWAASSHKLQYKQEHNVPPPVRRSISRVAALLETVDLELERVLDERDEYRSTLAATSVERILQDADATLDVDLLQRLLSAEFPEENREEDEEYGALLQELFQAGIRTSRQLKDLLTEHKDTVFAEEKQYVAINRKKLRTGKELTGTTEDRTRSGVYFTHAGLLRRHLFAAGFELTRPPATRKPKRRKPAKQAGERA
jgi:hypothetical protein